MEKPNFKERMNNLGKEATERNADSAGEDTVEKPVAPTKSKAIPYTNRICPFMSTPEKDVYCTARCKLFRDQAAGYNCPIPEIFAISYKLGIGKKKK